MGKLFRQDYTVTFYATDMSQQIKLSHLINHALFVSGAQAYGLGISDQAIFEEHGLVWIVTDYEIEIKRLPRFLETITIETEAVSYNKLFCYREFRVFDQAGQLLVTILATFVLMDYATRRVRPVLEELVAPFEAVYSKSSRRGAKYPDLPATSEQVRQVTYFDMDMNGHVNNSRYIDWLFDSLTLDFLQAHLPKKIAVKYAKEIHYGAEVTTAVALDGRISHHTIRTAEGICTQAMIEWESKTELY